MLDLIRSPVPFTVTVGNCLMAISDGGHSACRVVGKMIDDIRFDQLDQVGIEIAAASSV